MTLNHSFIRFLIVGVINTIVGLSFMYLFLNLVGWNYWVSTFLGNGIGMICSYFLNKRFTFQSGISIGKSFWKFVLVSLVCYGVSYWLGLYLSSLSLSLFDRMDKKIAENIAVLVSTGFYTITNYLGHRFFTFREKGDVAMAKQN